MAGHAYKSAVDELDNGVGRDLDAPFRATVLEPVGKLCSYYPTINEAIAKRNKKVSRHQHLTLVPGCLTLYEYSSCSTTMPLDQKYGNWWTNPLKTRLSCLE